MLVIGRLDEARAACRELEAIAEPYDGGALPAVAAHARGRVDLAGGDARVALASLRRARELWLELEAPYEAARVRELIGLACRALGDEDTAALELEAARAGYAELGAEPDLVRLGDAPGGLTERELEVLRHLAAGETNKEIAAELVLSDRTIDRHVSNIFAKLGVSSRASATAYAYEHRLL
jgi:ATP/maltotriose-dependent transcriptional regulator MalT